VLFRSGLAALAAIGQGKIQASALILVDIAVLTERAGYDRIRNFMLKGSDGFDTILDAANALAEYRGTPTPNDVSGLAKAMRLGKDGRYRWHWDPRFLEARHQDIDIREERMSSYARRVKCPTLMIRGGNSDVVSAESALHFQSLCPHAQLVNVKGAGHMLVGDKNDTLGAAAGPFLDAIRQSMPISNL